MQFSILAAELSINEKVLRRFAEHLTGGDVIALLALPVEETPWCPNTPRKLGGICYDLSWASTEEFGRKNKVAYDTIVFYSAAEEEASYRSFRDYRATGKGTMRQCRRYMLFLPTQR